MSLTDQLSRIKSKLQHAKEKDQDFNVFGAERHRYEFNPPLSIAEVKLFEAEFGVRLPPEYVAFITLLGNGGPGYFGGAGPYYGIYPLREFGYMQINAGSMSAPCVINSSLTREKWTELTAFNKDAGDSDGGVIYDLQYKALFNGLMTIGTQGSNYQTMLALNGDDYGRVVFIDQDLSMPSVAKEKHFFDWYEHWLDRLL